MSTQNCVVTRSFRGAELFLSSLENHGFVWSADRSNALRMNSDEALATVKRFEQWSAAEPESAVCNVLDSKGHVLSSGSVMIPQREPMKFSKEYADGRAARDNRVRRSLNPYGLTGERAVAWFNGHDDRSEEIEGEIDAIVYNRTVGQDHC